MSNTAIKTLFRPEVLAMSAYHVADASNYIKLDAMENPYTWPNDIRQHWLELLMNCSLNRYPDPEAKELSATIRQSNQIPEQSGLLLGNGSDEIIQILMMALPNSATILAPEPSFVMYKQVAQSLGLKYQGVPLLPDSFDLDLDAMLQSIEETQPSIIFLAYPNNPTGNLFDKQAIKDILAAAPGLVVVDEAYAPFANASFLDQLTNYQNLLVMRTLSKLGLAGLRLGFLIGNKDTLDQLSKIRLPYNINCLTQSTASFALKKQEFLLDQTQTICQQRGLMLSALQAISGIKPYTSAANFILFRTLHKPSTDVFNSLKKRRILIKNLAPQGGLISNCLRVTIGTQEENQIFLEALTSALAEPI